MKGGNCARRSSWTNKAQFNQRELAFESEANDRVHQEKKAANSEDIVLKRKLIDKHDMDPQEVSEVVANKTNKQHKGNSKGDNGDRWQALSNPNFVSI